MHQNFECAAFSPSLARALEVYYRRHQRLDDILNTTPKNFSSRDWVLAKLRHMTRTDQHCLAPNPQGLSAQEFKTFIKVTEDHWKKLHLRNNADMKEIVDHHGWFASSVWGPRAEEEAWLIVQHADEDIELQRNALHLMEPLLKAGEIKPSHYAYLYDRVMVNPRNPDGIQLQRYGTQCHKVDSRWEAQPMEDPANIDARRKAMGIEPETLSEYLEIMNELSKMEYGGRPPPEPEP